MKLNDSVSCHIQSSEGMITVQGIQQVGQDVVALDTDSALLVLAHANQEQSSHIASKAVEILIDDVSLNLADITQQTNSRVFLDHVAHCLNESFDNINEYLFSQSVLKDSSSINSDISLIALQFLPTQLSVISVGDFNCFFQSEQEVTRLIEKNIQKFGQGNDIQPVLYQHSFSENNQVLLMKSSEVEIIEPEFIQLTLSRFNDNPEMALRQINTRAQHQKLAHKPTLILCRVEQATARSGGWFAKLRNR